MMMISTLRVPHTFCGTKIDPRLKTCNKSILGKNKKQYQVSGMKKNYIWKIN